MKCIDFSQATKSLGRPPGTTKEECVSLRVWNADGKHCISCWKPNWKDRIRLLLGQPIWLWIWSGQTQPPVSVTTDNPFPIQNKN